MPSIYKQWVNEYKYAEIPEEPRYRKKKKPMKIKRSDHKHVYEPCLFKVKKWDNLNVKPFYGGSYCIICGRIKDFTIGSEIITNYSAPTFEIEDMSAKYVDLGD